jgi:hypothetical protein
MKMHLIYIAVATIAFKLLFHKVDTLYLLLGVSFAYFAGMAPWAVYSFITRKLQRDKPSLEEFMNYAKTPDYKKKSTLANEIFHSFPQLPSDQDLKKTEIRDLRVAIGPSDTDTDRFCVTVENRGKTSYKGLIIELRNILGWAESFGIDTTHMPSSSQYAGNSDVKIDVIAPKEVIRAEVSGYGIPGKYRHYRTRYAKVFPFPRKETAHLQWCEIHVNLPGATDA